MIKVRMMSLMVMLTAIGLTFITVPAHADLDADDRVAIQREIETYIKANPEILRDALVALAAREDIERRRAGMAQLRDDAGDPVMGNPDGKITLYEFSDYNCGYCKRMFGAISSLLSSNPDVRLVIKEFPILSQSSLVAAKAGIAAQKQGKFPAFHTAMMTYRGQVSDESIAVAAREAGVDLEQFKRDMTAAETNRIIERTRRAAAVLEINGTPGFIIEDRLIPGAVDIKQLQALIDQARAK